MITEEALPTYMTMLNTLDGVRDETGASKTPWATWTRAWTGGGGGAHFVNSIYRCFNASALLVRSACFHTCAWSHKYAHVHVFVHTQTHTDVHTHVRTPLHV